MALHKNLTGSDLHEPKGADTATSGKVYVSDGAGSGIWTAKGTLTTGENISCGDITATGTVTVDTLLLSDTVWDDFVVPFSATSGGGTLTAPTWACVNDPTGAATGSTTTGVWTYSFSKTATNSVVATIQLPHHYKPGTDLRPHLHWIAPDATAGNVVWGLEYWVLPYNSLAYNTTTTIIGVFAAPGAAKTATIASFYAYNPSLVISGTGLVESTIIMCRIYREGGNLNDTYDNVAYGLSFDIHYESNKLGTDNELPS